MTARWYGEDIAFRSALEAAARRRYGRHLTVRLTEPPPARAGHPAGVGDLVYQLDNIEVRGRHETTPVEVRFYAELPPPYRNIIDASDYPHVFADRRKPSPHRLSDLSLCLYYPADPPELRWRSEMGLLALLDAAAEHLCFEDYWRRNKDWLGREAPHGIHA